MIFKNLWRRKIRTLLTALGIAVGVAAVVALSAFGEGLASGFERILSGAKPDLQVSQKEAIMAFMSSVDEEIGDELRQLSGVEDVAGVVIGATQMTGAPYFLVAGEDPRGFSIERYRLIAGHNLTGRRQVMLGKTTAQNFKKEVGSSIRINDTSYRVVGIYETGVALEDGGAVMSLTDAQRAFEMDRKVSYFNIKTKGANRIDPLKKEIEERWPDLAAVRSGDASSMTETTNMYRSFGLFIGIIAVLVGGLGMMNSTLMSVFERTREIGVLRAVGWRRRRVVQMILGESLALALLGGGLGILLGIGLTQLTRLSPAVASMLEGVFTPSIFIQALLIALVLGAVGGVYPALRAAQLAPVEAMRYEGGAVAEMGPVTRQLARLFRGSALRNLFRRPVRTFVTVAGIGLAVGFIVALSSMSNGMINQYTAFATSGQADLVAQEAGISDMGLSRVDERVADRLATQPQVKSVSRLLWGVSTAPGMQFFLVFGLDPREEWIKHYRVREGRMIERSREIMLGRQAANGLKKGVGETMRVSGSSYTIVGIYENGIAYEDSSGVMLLKDAQERFGMPRKISLLSLQLHDPSQADAIARQLEAQFPDVIISRAEEMTRRAQDFQTMNTILGALVTLTMVVGGIVMMNAMLMSVFERTQEIGVLRALGWRRRRVVGMVLVESLGLSALSALMGIVIGVALGQAFTLLPVYGSYMAPVYTPQVFLQVVALALVLGAVGGLYPAWRAANLQPIEALRYE